LPQHFRKPEHERPHEREVIAHFPSASRARHAARSLGERVATPRVEQELSEAASGVSVVEIGAPAWAGLALGAMAAVFGLIDFVTVGRAREHAAGWINALGNAAVLALARPAELEPSLGLGGGGDPAVGAMAVAAHDGAAGRDRLAWRRPGCRAY